MSTSYHPPKKRAKRAPCTFYFNCACFGSEIRHVCQMSLRRPPLSRPWRLSQRYQLGPPPPGSQPPTAGYPLAAGYPPGSPGPGRLAEAAPAVEAPAAPTAAAPAACALVGPAAPADAARLGCHGQAHHPTGRRGLHSSREKELEKGERVEAPGVQAARAAGHAPPSSPAGGRGLAPRAPPQGRAAARRAAASSASAPPSPRRSHTSRGSARVGRSEVRGGSTSYRRKRRLLSA